MPFELRPVPQRTLEPEGEYLQRAWNHHVFPLARQMGVEIRLPRVSPQPHTHLAFEGYQYAREQNLGNAYNHRMMRAFFVEEQDIGETEVLVGLAREVGLNADEFRSALETRRYREAHQQALRHAYEEAAIRAVPTFLIGEVRLEGLQSREALERAIEQASQASGS